MRNFLGVLVTAVLMGNTAFAFELAKDSTGTVVRWRTSQVRFNVSTRTFKNLDQAAVLKAAQAAASTMAQVMPGVAVNIAQGNAQLANQKFLGCGRGRVCPAITLRFCRGNAHLLTGFISVNFVSGAGCG